MRVFVFANKAILITGGTGSFGRAFVKTITEKYPDYKKIVVFSRDELKQYEFSAEPGLEGNQKMRFFLGDVRDADRLRVAMAGIDIVIHAAALKQVPAAEYNPFEVIKTNVIGAQNVIEACLLNNVEKVISLSTDKAAAPINLYGASKLCADKLFTAAKHVVGGKRLKLATVRYGNVFGSRGSVVPFFLNKKPSGTLPITSSEMTRFNISLENAVEMVLWAIKNMEGGEIFVPKIPSYRIMDLAEAICPKCEKKIIGIRPGEKIHEEMITASDSFTTVDLGAYFAILTSDGRLKNRYDDEGINYSAVKPGFAYDSESNSEYLTVDQIRSLIRDHVDPYFMPV